MLNLIGLKQLGLGNYKFKDVNKLLSLDEKSYIRLIFELANLGYDISDYEKISKLSDGGYSNVLRMSN